MAYKGSEKHKAQQRLYYAKNKEKIYARTKTWLEANPEKRLAYQQKSNELRSKDPKKARVGEERRTWKHRGLTSPASPRADACECCGRPAWLETKNLALDHDHATGVFRGWLCVDCNLGIGKLGDTIAGVEKALAYLTRTRPT